MNTRSKITEDLKAYINRLQSSSQATLISESDLEKHFKVNSKRFQSAVQDLIKEEALIRVFGRGIFIPVKNTVLTLHIFLPPDIKETNPSYERLLGELKQTAAKYSIDITDLETARIESAPDEAVLVILGLIKDKAILEKLLAAYNRIVAVENYSDYNDRISQIYFNDYKIGRQAADMLTQYNHKKILLLAGPEQYSSSFYRKNGFLEEMAKRGIKTLVLTGQMNAEGGYQAGDYIMHTIPEAERPTAVFAANDSMAAGFIKKLKEYEVNIPQDISIISCDDAPSAGGTEPALTAFNLDMRYLVMELMALINRLSAADDHMTQKIVLPAALILRDSLIKK